MRERQPDGTDLPPSGCQAVDDAARDDEMRLGVIVGQDEAFVEVDDPRGEPGEQRDRGEQPLWMSCAGYNHGAATCGS